MDPPVMRCWDRYEKDTRAEKPQLDTIVDRGSGGRECESRMVSVRMASKCWISIKHSMSDSKQHTT